ncbi:MAG: hypothetical protein NC131_17165 [Roseburia sp.]|nr:hypothetical protein [Roseburia sp.]
MVSLKQAIIERHSVRTFDCRDLTVDDAQFLDSAIAYASAPIEGRFTIRQAVFPTDGTTRPGSYGVIRGAVRYLLLYVGNRAIDRMAGGFALERIVLEATLRGLSTCWIGGTFRKSTFGDAASPIDGMRLTIILPIGYKAARKRIIDRLTSFVARSHTRLPFDCMFHGTTDRFTEPLEMMRLAPSSVNSQPWRAVASTNSVEFTSTASGGLHDIDMGIGLCHFCLSAESIGLNGRLTVDNPETNSARWTLE